VDYYLPRGRWTRLLTGETEEGGRWIRENHGFLSLPLWVRPNSFVAVGAVDHRPDYTYAEDADLRLYALEEGQRAKVQVRDTKGVVALTVSAEREQQALRIGYEGTGAPFRISLYSMGAVAAVEGSGVEAGLDAQSVRIPAGASAGEITIRLE
jgi:alpha-D-xyloside xylohydrolase